MAYYIKGLPFRYKGTINVEDCSTAQEVIEKAKLDWQVEKAELYAEMPMSLNPDANQDGYNRGGNFYSPINGNYAIFRKDLNIPLGVVKDKYTPVQNIDAFKFFDDAIGKDKAIWQTAGFFGNGEKVFVTAKLPKHIFVNGDVIDNYLVFATSHDGSMGVKVLLTPIRVVCENTLNAALKDNDAYISFRHTESVHSKLDVASQILGICDVKAKALEELYNGFNKIHLTDDQAADYFAKLILTDKEYSELYATDHKPMQLVLRSWDAMNDSGISTRKCNTIAEIYYYYMNGIGQEQFRGTGWGAYNAVNGYYSNVDNIDGQKRMDTLLFGDKANKIKQSSVLMKEMLKAA